MRGMIPDSRALRVVLRSIEDVDAMASALSDGLEADYVQLEPRRFVVRWSIVHVTGLVVQFGSGDLAIVRRLRVPQDRWAFVVPLELPRSGRWNGRAVHADDIIVCPPGSELFAFDPRGTRFAIISVGSGTPLASAVREATGPAAAPVTIAGGASAQVLRDSLERLRRRAESGRTDGLDATSLARGIAGAIAGCVTQRRDEGPTSKPSASRSGIVWRAEQFFRSRVGETVSIAQLSSVAGVSERSLRNAFYDVYTTSPKRYMKLWQLHQVRRALRHPDVGGETVTDVATLHGFFELGRFAGEYKSLFGEAPSQTLNNARHRHAVNGADDAISRPRRIA
jgi:AraC-like DNA-binding protein